MTIKHVLMGAPLLLMAGLLQAYLWVPSYDSQGASNAARLRTFVEASAADAKILNPILNADTASSRVTGLVFDGLLDLDEDLVLRGRLAESWHIDETADLVVRVDRRLPGGEAVTAAGLAARIRAHAAGHPVLGDILRDVEVVPAGPVEIPPASAGEAPTVLTAPARVRMRLARVEQDLLQHLLPALGERYADDFDPRRLPGSEASSPLPDRITREQALEALPLLAHHPRIRFELRHGVRFHDGHEFDAGDVAFTYAAIMDERNLSPRSSDFEPIDRVVVVDDHTVDVIYKRLFSPAINAWMIGILPAHLLGEERREAEMRDQGVGDEARERFGMRSFGFNRAPVGTGPFRFVAWRGDEQVELARFEDYWEGPPLYRRYFFRVLPDSLTREIEFRTGTVDTYAPEPHQAARYLADARYQAFSNPDLGYTYIGYNNRRAPFDDVRVRRALGMAIDVDQIIRYVLYGEGERTTGPYPTTTPWYDRSVAPLPYDPDGARRLLAEAGWVPDAQGWLGKDGKRLEFNLITNNGNAVRKAVLAIAQDAWRGIGVKVNTQLFEWAVFLEDFINPAEFDAVVLGWRTGIDSDQYQIWHSSQSGKNQLNFVGYRSAAADELMIRLRREYDFGAQQRLAHELHRRIAADQPYTFLYAKKMTRVLDRRIVMRSADGGIEPVRAGRGGDIYAHMNRWLKLERAPD